MSCQLCFGLRMSTEVRSRTTKSERSYADCRAAQLALARLQQLSYGEGSWCPSNVCDWLPNWTQSRTSYSRLPGERDWLDTARPVWLITAAHCWQLMQPQHDYLLPLPTCCISFSLYLSIYLYLSLSVRRHLISFVNHC